MAAPISKNDIVREIIRGIQYDVRLYDELYKLLLKQQHCYLSFDEASMQAITDKLQPMLDTLQKNAEHRTNLLGYLGLAQNKAGINRLINALPGKLRLQAGQQWQTLETRVQSCQQQNQLNGQLSASFSEMLQQFDHDNSNSYSSPKLMEQR
jgi:flagella synthesis protein FlgN